MAIQFHCACGKRLRAADTLAGKSTKCPACGTPLRIPVLDAPGSVTEESVGSPTEQGCQERADRALRDEVDNDSMYSLADEPEPRPTALPSRPVVPPTAASTFHPIPRERAGPTRRDASAPEPIEARPSSREYLYLVLALALIPLGFSLLAKESGSFSDRFERTMGKASPEVVAHVREILQNKEDAGLDDLLAVLPQGRLDDSAHLPRETWVHWLYGALAAATFWGSILGLFPGEKKTPSHLLLVGLFTGTIGIVLLLGFQFVAGATQGVWLSGRSIIVLLFYIAKFIGFSYSSASDPNSNFLLSFVGFTCGVGLCEELCKAFPLLVYFRRDVLMGWRGACVWGLASGVGFGVSEGIMYSAQSYNGISTAGIYVVRFVSCVALHAIWSASVGITLWKRQDSIQGDIDWGNFSLAVLRILAVPMVLHGLYDTLLKKDLNVLALAVGVLSFAWFAFQVETARGSAGEKARASLARA